MEQVSLNIRSRLAYAAESFVLHAGIRADYEKCLALLLQPVFRLCFFSTEPGGGKTHLSVKLLDSLADRGLQPVLLDARGFSALGADKPSADQRTVLIVDDAEQYFQLLSSADSGSFVAFIEHLRQQQAAVVFLSSRRIEDFRFDDHVRSRLLPGQGFKICAPSEEDLAPLLKAMLEQRGLSMPPRKFEFILRRMPRSIPGISGFISRLQHLALSTGGALDYPVLEACF